jgi:ribonucleoside-diphosphate reductase alpha chain
MEFEKYFNKSENVYDAFEFEKQNIDITDDLGKKIFTQKQAEFPKEWTHLARKIVASKYFYGELGLDERENSIKDLVGRVSGTFKEWAIKQDYFSEKKSSEFKDEITHIVLSQMATFNSPVWFNVGTHNYPSKKSNDRTNKWTINDKDQKISVNTKNYGHLELNFKKGQAIPIPIGKDYLYPQTSACFIQGVEDTMEDIMDLAIREADLFKGGSGTGTNLSSLRSSREKLSGGGKPSGPLAYWKFYDDVAGIVKSGGKTRRAAKMDILDVDHPDIWEFINSKKIEENKKRILIEMGIPAKEASETVAYQNTNISVRVNSSFMEAVKKKEDWQTIPVHNKKMLNEMPKYKAEKLLEEIANSTHSCGDPGMQFKDAINKWHTCKNSGEINSSNPCSEYFFIDNSSCNLASSNLLSFLDEKGNFDTESFEKVIETIAIAQDLEIDNSSYPTRKIAENSHNFRPLGMGYANLGSMLMYLGLPYDSDEARTTAAAITALMTGKVYETSTKMAEKLGSFEKFEKNKKPMLKVIEMHKKALQKIDGTKIPKGLENILKEAKTIWDNVSIRGNKYGFRNSQATVLAPTGTTGFMMDCDTKGIEPELGLVQTKLLSDGGTLKLVNTTVKPALERLGYSAQNIESILNHIKENETIEGSTIEKKHLDIFDCALKPENGKRTISPNGHLEMMAAVQPFLSGAISKTVNLPKETTIKEIENIYIKAHDLGLKSVALYRDGSKAMQPLNFSKKEEFRPIRKKLPITSESIRHKFNIAGHEGYLHVGLFEDGNPGEMFINMSKEGSTIGGLMDVLGISSSMCLQYGVPLETLVSKFKYQKFDPRGFVLEGHPDIKTANSVVDYIYTFLEQEFLNGNSSIKNRSKKESKSKKENTNQNAKEELGGICMTCGAQMIKKGNCSEICPECKTLDQKGCGQ